MKRIVFTANDALIVILLSRTNNAKIAPPNELVVQTFSYSRVQFDYAVSRSSLTMKNFFDQDADVCFDCPLSNNSRRGAVQCYTHKPIQYSGMLSQLRSIGKEYPEFRDIPTFRSIRLKPILDMCNNRYIRFGTYGEPSIMPEYIIGLMANVAKSWTGYTHQWRSRPSLSKWFMASVHSKEEEQEARQMGFRSFVTTSQSVPEFVHCPASRESGYITTCSKCKLCSGTSSKSKKSINIINH